MPEAPAIYFDLYKELTTNPRFANKIEQEFKAIRLAEKSGDREARSYHLMNALRLCDFNMALFIPYFFPDFSNGKAMSMWSRPHAIAMMSMVPAGSVTTQASRQIGKCLSGLTFLQVRGEKSETVENTTIAALFEEEKSKKRSKNAR